MNEKLSGAIEVLLTKLDEQARDIIHTKRMINSLRQMNGESPLFPDAELQESGTELSVLRSDLYYGKPLATAAREFLEWRTRACKADEVQQGLEQGGFDFDAMGWKKKDRLRSLSISLAKNNTVFHRLPNGTFGLLSWYPDIKPKSERRRNQGNNIEEEDKKEEGQTGD